jgi:hypothetical protein
MSLTEWLQKSRFTVVAVDPARGRVRLKGGPESEAETCSDLHCSPRTLVVADDATDARLETLNPGDIVRVQARGGRARKIVVLRRVWDELTSPEL